MMDGSAENSEVTQKTVEVQMKAKVVSSIQELEARLAEQRELLALLKKHPDMERAFTLMGSMTKRY